MEPISYQQLFDSIGIYREDGGQVLLAVLFAPGLKKTMTFAQAAADASVSFVCSSVQPQTEEDAKKLLLRCAKLLESAGGGRGILWVGEKDGVVLPVTEDFSHSKKLFCPVVSGTKANGIQIKIQAGTSLRLEAGELVFPETLDFSFGELQLPMAVHSIRLVLAGSGAGTLAVFAALAGRAFEGVFCCGFEYGFSAADGRDTLISSRLFADGSFLGRNLEVCFVFGFHAFTGNRIVFQKDSASFRIKSNFRTIYGEPVFLVPVTEPGHLPADRDDLYAGMAFLPRISQNITCAPSGTYRVFVDGDMPRQIRLLCGYSGTEYFAVDGGGLIRFFENEPAFCGCFPKKDCSIADFTNGQHGHLLSDEMVTSGLSFCGTYDTQPCGSPFFCCGESPGILEPAPLCIDIGGEAGAEIVLPVLPYQGVRVHVPDTGDAWAQAADISAFETQILTAERMIRCQEYVRQTAGYVPANRTENALVQAASPSGFIGELAGGQFVNMQIACSPGGNLTFYDMKPALRTAFLDPAMFCVLAHQNIGGFSGRFSIGDWQFTLNPGYASDYNQYANILLIKAYDGKIYDPADSTAGLCTNSRLWTCGEGLSKPEKGEIANLSVGLTDYCRSAYEKWQGGDENFALFVKAVTDPGWKGMLALHVTLDKRRVAGAGSSGNAKAASYRVPKHSKMPGGQRDFFGGTYTGPAFQRSADGEPERMRYWSNTCLAGLFLQYRKKQQRPLSERL